MKALMILIILGLAGFGGYWVLKNKGLLAAKVEAVKPAPEMTKYRGTGEKLLVAGLEQIGQPFDWGQLAQSYFEL